MAAGLAHELNNPAAAAQRCAAQLQEYLTAWWKLTLELVQKETRPDLTGSLEKLLEEIQRRSSIPAGSDALQRLDREGSIQQWLEEHGIDEAWQFSPPLADLGWSPSELDNLASSASPQELPLRIRWLATGCLVYSLLNEVHLSAGRMSQIVKAVKTYTYLDQAPIQEVDVHEGLESTLVMLHFKLKPGVNVLRQYAPDLPRIEAYASELNQVWTNLVDNAVDAMQGQGELVIRTYARMDHVVVEIQDSGSGIPPAIQPRIFEPFFTTKPPGSGTGLGLSIVYDIVVHKHRGEIHVSSRPGETCFQVILPVRLEGNKK
jgi:signal transduction histidine kinase